MTTGENARTERPRERPKEEGGGRAATHDYSIGDEGEDDIERVFCRCERVCGICEVGRGIWSLVPMDPKSFVGAYKCQHLILGGRVEKSAKRSWTRVFISEGRTAIVETKIK